MTSSIVQLQRGKPREDGDVVDSFLACHKRIRSFLELARTLGTRSDVAASEVVDACTRIERYFVEAFPLHMRDEEESVRPRLLGKRPDVDAALAAMAREHVEHERALAELLAATRALANTPAEVAAARERVRRAAEAWTVEIEWHLEREEDVVFPAIRSLLSDDDQRAILAELRARRG